MEISGIGKLRQAEYSEKLRFLLIVENRYPQMAALRQKEWGKKLKSLRDFPTVRAAKGARNAQSFLLRRKDRWTRLSQCTQPSRLGTFGSFRHSILLAGNTAPRPLHSDTQSAASSFQCTPARKPTAPTIAPGQPEVGPTYSSYWGIS